MKNKVYIIEESDHLYPNKLKHISKYPLKLYAKGNLDLLNHPAKVAIVGSRSPSTYGKEVTKKIASELAEKDICVVSGLAMGIDAIAHQNSRYGEGLNTIAVLGCGLNYIYPKTNEDIYYDILKKGGLILSEFEWGVKPLKYNFPKRNRIISGLSDGVIVIEGKEKSGSLITAKHGLEQGKNIYAVPGSIFSPYSQGPNQLIKQGAMPLTCTEDILEDLQYCCDFDENIKNLKKIHNFDSIAEQLVYTILQTTGEMSIENLINTSKLPIKEVQKVLIKLEINDMIKRLNLDTYIVK